MPGLTASVALLLPSYGRQEELEKVLRETPLGADARFIVVANYPDDVLDHLRKTYGDRADVLDEREHGRLGGAKAYSLAFDYAKQKGYRHTIHYADDVLPARRDWIARATSGMDETRADIGIFSSDEGHFGTFGWNMIKGVPYAHFFIADVNALDIYFDPQYRQYVVDLEIVARVLRQDRRVALLPVKLRHYRSPLAREEMSGNYEYDLATFLRDYPEFEQELGHERMLTHRHHVTVVDAHTELPGLVPWPPHKAASARRIRRRAAGALRRIRNLAGSRSPRS